jgi:hypothetical protein
MTRLQKFLPWRQTVLEPVTDIEVCKHESPAHRKRHEGVAFTPPHENSS